MSKGSHCVALMIGRMYERLPFPDLANKTTTTTTTKFLTQRLMPYEGVLYRWKDEDGHAPQYFY